MPKKKVKLGSKGPAPHWLKLSVAKRAETKQRIKEGLLGYTRSDGVIVPGARRIFADLKSTDGFDLRHIERWSAAKLDKARNRVAALNTLTGRPFQVISPRSRAQRKEAQKFTGQNLPYQKSMIVQVQNPKIDKAIFLNGKVTVERTHKLGSKNIQQRYLFADYATKEEIPKTFLEAVPITKRMLEVMPKEYRKTWVYYTLLTVQYGPIGESVPHHRLLETLASYHADYDTKRGHKGFAADVIGFQAVGTHVSAMAYQRERDANKSKRKQMKKLRFRVKTGKKRK